MKKAPVIILLVFASVAFCSCNKLTVGNITDKTLEIKESFQVVELRDDIGISLIHCDASHKAGDIHIKTGENLIDNINAKTERHFEVNENGDSTQFTKLVISNDNAFNNFRPHNHEPQMTIYYDSLYKIIFYSNSLNIHTDTLRGYLSSTHFSNDTIEWDSLAPNLILDVQGGSGNFNILVNCYKLMTKYIHGTSLLTTKGKATLASTYADYDCHGVIDSKELDSHIHYITTHSTNIIRARTSYLLDVTNNNIGEVHYQKYFAEKKEYFWNDSLHHTDSIVRTIVCPEVIHYNGEYLDPWTYDNEKSGLQKLP